MTEIMNTSDNYLFNIQTVQSSAFRILIESLKDILTDCNFIIDETGIKLIATDSSHNVLIHMKLLAENFDFYKCKGQHIIGVNMTNMYKLIKTMNNSDILTLFLETNNTNLLGIQINNKEKNSQTVYKLNLLDISDENIKIPPATFETELTLPSSDFQKLIRDMVNIGELIEIKSVGNELILCCNGDFASQETSLSETNTGLQFSQVASLEEPIQGIFSLKYLLLFTKCTNMCNQIHIYIKNDYPLVITYSVANLGDIKLCLAPNVC
jgi:proliferating cell nuclear antigen|tara:strand:+ start:875 stop:1675 length:801 start_codon:yes stop_codon:yes gene_type:complete